MKIECKLTIRYYMSINELLLVSTIITTTQEMRLITAFGYHSTYDKSTIKTELISWKIQHKFNVENQHFVYTKGIYR